MGQIKSGVIEDGTAIGNGLATAINRLKESDAKSKVIILLTDGVNNSGQIAPLTAAEIAATLDIKVYTVGVGSQGMAPYPAVDMWGNTVYQKMKVEIDEKTLSEIAAMTGGALRKARLSLKQGNARSPILRSGGYSSISRISFTPRPLPSGNACRIASAIFVLIVSIP
jgi:hypothetical protein